MVQGNFMKSFSETRREWKPQIPPLFESLAELSVQAGDKVDVASQVAPLFPRLKERECAVLVKGGTGKRLKIGALFSGGPAAGGHNVLAGLFDAIQAMSSDSTLIGFLGGPSGLVKNEYKVLNKDAIDSCRNQGGFNLLGTGRTKLEKEDQFAACLETAKVHGLDGIVIIGGDDSNTNAAFLADYFLSHGSKTSVVGVPKTIDGDLMNRWIEQSFGFDSAAKTYSELAGNVAKDALSQGKYYFFIKVMGRTASHLLLETALNTRPNLALISEEIVKDKLTLDQVVAKIADVIVERAKRGLQHGVILIPEGLIECFPEFKTINPDTNPIWNRLPPSTKEQLLLERDPHGNIPVSKIETERLLIHFVEQELLKRSDYKGVFQPQPLFFGYEGRCCYPTEFDANYCYALGITAAVLIKENRTGCIACIKNLLQPVEQWQGMGVPLIAMMNLEERKGVVKPVIRKGLVDLNGDKFKRFKGNRETDTLEDRYISPGPIQFS